VFVDNGAGVRGDLKAVVRAILLDPEAREGDTNLHPAGNIGRLKEPVLVYSSTLRGIASQGSDHLNLGIYMSRLDLSLNDLGENPHDEPSVFSFFSPDYSITFNGTTLYSPEFQLSNTSQVAWYDLHLQDIVDDNWDEAPSGAISINLSATSPLGLVAQNSGPGPLVDALNGLFMHGTMPDAMKQIIVGEISGLPAALMVRTAVFMIVTSPQFQVAV
jgi:hypothetical protein